MTEHRQEYPSRVRDALYQRLRAVADELGVMTSESDDGTKDAASLAYDLSARVLAVQDQSELWLFYVAVSTVFPDRRCMAELTEASITLRVGSFADWVLTRGLTIGAIDGDLAIPLRLISGQVMVDVSFSAVSDHNTGIQRVVRSAAEHWDDDPEVIFAADLGPSGALRNLDSVELDRLVRWNNRTKSTPSNPEYQRVLLVPWHSRVLLPEVPTERRLNGLAVMAATSGNAVSAIGHDTIPLSGRQFVPAAETRRFSRFLGVVKELKLIVGVSHAAQEEFSGLSQIISDTATTRVVARLLPIVSNPNSHEVVDEPRVPLILAVGSKEPRKNQDAIVYCAERLWREGHVFELLLVGSRGWSTTLFMRWLRVARKNGRSISAPFSFTDAALWDAYERATFTVFPSLEEGFGLPIAESLSRGVPVITSDYGSMSEIAAAGGCLTVDPRDDEAILDAMRILLSDPQRLEELRQEARARPTDSWKQYADDVLALVRQT